jgi:hypothetical protein
VQQHPTDQELLQVIYDRYYKDFLDFPQDSLGRKSKVHVPIDIPAIASTLGVDAELVFGRLYYYLQEKYGAFQSDGTQKTFFALEVGGDRHCINFPVLASVLAELRHEDKKYRLPLWIAIASLLVSAAALLVSIFGHRAA